MSTRKKLPTNNNPNKKIIVSKKSLRSSPTTFLSLLPQNQYYQDQRQEKKRQEQDAIIARKKRNERLNAEKKQKFEQRIIDAEKFRPKMWAMENESIYNSDDEDEHEELIGLTWKTVEEKPKPIRKSPTMFSLNKLGGRKRTSGKKNGKHYKTKKILYKKKSKTKHGRSIAYKK
jgi:hypothetical protein